MKKLRRALPLIVLATAGMAAPPFYLYWYAPRLLAENERKASAALKTIATAQADFRANDRDGDRIQNFWTGDVAGLYHLPDSKSKSPMRLIEQWTADADTSPIPRHAKPPVPFMGYYFVALESDRTISPAEPLKGPGGAPSYGPYYHNSKFAFAAYPAEYGKTGRLSFILNEGNTMWRADLKGSVPTHFPPIGRCGRCWLEELTGHACPPPDPWIPD